MGTTVKSCTYLLHRIYKAMKEDGVTLSLQRGVHPEQGRLYPKENGEEDIQVNPRGDLLSTVIHEYIHHLMPKLNEDEVLAAEATMCENLTNKQWANLLYRVADIIRTGEEED